MYYLALLKERINQKLRHLAFLLISLILSDKALAVVAFKETITGGFFLILFSATGDLFSLFMALWSIATIALVVFAYLRREQMLEFCRKWQEGQTFATFILPVRRSPLLQADAELHGEQLDIFSNNPRKEA